MKRTQQITVKGSRNLSILPKYIRATLVLALCLCTGALHGQDGIYAVAKKRGDKIVFKLAIERADAFVQFTQQGISVERAKVEEGDTADFSVVVSELKPADREAWEEVADISAAEDVIYLLFDQKSEEQPSGFLDKLEAAKRLEGRHFFYMLLSSYHPELSRRSGLEFEDNPGDGYFVYRFSINGLPKNMKYTGIAGVDKEYLPEQFPTVAPEIIERDQQVDIVWNHADFSNRFIGYHIERSSDGSTFRRITDVPLIYNSGNDLVDERAEGFMNYSDSLPLNYQTYYYRVVGMDYFGEKGSPSNAVKAQGRDRTAPKNVEKLAARFTGARIDIQWTYDNPPGDLQGFFVLKSNASATGPFQPLNTEPLSPSTRSFSDDEVDVEAKNFYAVFAVDTAGNYQTAPGVYAMIQDTFPPAPPVGLTADIDSNGVVTLHWDMPTEPDIRGYRVYRAVKESFDFIQITQRPILATSHKDTVNLKTLDENIFYRVTALDMNFNHSPYSDPILVKKPDTVPPQAPVLTEVTVREGSVFMKWKPSYSSDLAGYQIYATKNGERNLINIVSKEINTYTYEPEDGNRNTVIDITAIDDDGLESEPSNSKRAVLELDPAIAAPTIEAKAEDGKVRITYAHNGNDKVRTVYIMRKLPDADYEMIRDYELTEGALYDVSGVPGKKYTYRLLLVLENGEKTPFSNEVVQKYPKP